jgi:site-specific DNA recombinase
MLKKNKKALIYCRVSSDRQKVEGNGLDSQEHRCREYAKSKGYEVEAVFRDSFTGGGDFMKRPAMTELLAHIDNKPYDEYVVIFDDLKRFARDTTFHWKLRNELKARQATPECLNFNFEDTAEGEFIETVLAAQGQLERKQNQRQVIQKQKARIERGYWPFYPPPGYTQIKDLIHGKLLTPNHKADMAREALNGFASGRFQEQVDVQHFLQKMDFREGKPVYLEYVKRLLIRVIYAGYIEYPKWEVSRRKGHHEGLISLLTYEKIMEKLSGSVSVRTRKDIGDDFPLRGFVLCAHCHRPCTASWTRKPRKNYQKPYYRCNHKGCPLRNKSIDGEFMEKEFRAILRGIHPSEHTLKLSRALLLRRWEKKVTEVEQVNGALERELEGVQGEISNLTKVAGKATNEKVLSAYEKEIEKLSNKELALMERMQGGVIHRTDFETALTEVFSILKNPHDYWVNGDIYDKRLVLKMVFQEPLAYNRESAFETAVLSLPLRVFEYSATSNSLGVEMARIELASAVAVPQCVP